MSTSMEHPVVEAGADCTAQAIQPAEFRSRLRTAAPRIFYFPLHSTEKQICLDGTLA